MKNQIQYLCILVCILSGLISSCKKGEVPTLTTSETTNISGATAMSGGTITREGSGTVISRGVCWGTSTIPDLTGNKTIDGAGAGSFASEVIGLDAATEYFIRAYATNDAGTGYGMTMSFTTLGGTPITLTYPVTKLSTSTATLNGAINPNYLSATVSFEYGFTTIYGNSVSYSVNPVTGSTNKNVSADITGLLPGTNYHYRIKAVNSLGTMYGEDIPFTTLGAAPIALTYPATGLSTSTATLNGSVNPNYLSATVSFEYGTSTIYDNSVSYSVNPVTGSANKNVSADITGLLPGTNYHYRIKAINSLGTMYGEDIPFTTLGQKPTVFSFASPVRLATVITLGGIVNPNYLTTVVTFEYGVTTDYGNSISAVPNPLSGNVNTNIAVILSDFTEGQTYHFRIKAVNELGITYSEDKLILILNSVFDIDGNGYQPVAIGTQEWMSQNLITTKYNDGTNIPNITDTFQWSALTSGAYCWYNNNEAVNKYIYGALYNWYSVESGKLCPLGWRVPTDADWSILENYLSSNGFNYNGLPGSNNYAISLASKDGWTSSNVTGAVGNTDFPEKRNSTGFNGLPGGVRDANQNIFGSIGNYGMWWTSTENNFSEAWDRGLATGYRSVGRANVLKSHGFSVRCMKD